ncbi:phosphatidate cytidylyltransferase [Bdellovibrio bacteriovorus]|uniref:Phosphatidate cytidylyltransferase n=1 Tax=Bdellovibrio bacteriovorus TaxID=959 RepID=A0A150WW66_BDEBC|nr:phosphatidate cytidylyltransferase [Bdellovibrio bacteriovorus]KYG70760.1 phosphatidate cytidylyltransferase [Bdellovibrio bacteriovorus]
MTTWKSFQTRAVSAAVALALIIGLYITLNVQGLKIAIAFVVAVGTWELITILFKNEKSILLKGLFYFLTLAIFGATLTSLSTGGIIYSIALIIMIIAVLLSAHKEGNLSYMADAQAKAALGFFYMGLLPAFAFRILDQAHGIAWFVYLLAVVFAGDTMAYVFGVLIGKHKVMPSVSPKKTWQGSVGGIIGSMIAGYICWQFLFSEQPLGLFLILAGISGFVGQFGDFFESLLKRVADVKDSGKIMPGHGGVLDRIDGVLFASPVVLAGILILSHLLS